MWKKRGEYKESSKQGLTSAKDNTDATPPAIGQTK